MSRVFPAFSQKLILTNEQMQRLYAGLCPECESDRVIEVEEAGHRAGRCRACGLTVILKADTEVTT